ncbi:MAG: radical SAM protein [Thermoanaerobaculia bacterium]|nr:MAG: radical SAM protein [Thermoanaerobaculia bacterium]
MTAPAALRPSGSTGVSPSAAPEAEFDPRRFPPGVLYLSLASSDVCNYRCRHCHIWLQKERPRPLSRQRRLELIAEFSRLSPGGTVVLPGGEVTLEWEELLAVAGACRDAALPLFVLTNGSRIDSEAAARALMTSGITHVAVSLDSHRPELHVYTRGVASAFEEATGAIRRLAAARDAVAPQVKVQAACVLFRENLGAFSEYVEFCRGLGAQHVDFQLLARTFANSSRGRDVFFEKHFWHAPEEKREARRLLGELIERWGDDPLVVKTRADLAWMLAYVDDPDYRTEHPVCGSHRMNLHVDAEGNAALCFNTAAILEHPHVGNAGARSLAELWTGEKAAEDRRTMDLCTLNCGALNCHRRRAADA